MPDVVFISELIDTLEARCGRSFVSIRFGGSRFPFTMTASVD